MKVFISADIEGVSGLTAWDDARANGRMYRDMCDQLSKEVAAACRGAKNAGYSEIVVKDSHGDGRNMDHNYLPENVKLIRGWLGNPYTMIGGMDESFNALIMIGYHDIAGSNGNPTAHTISSQKVESIRLNNKLVGEFHLQAYAATYLGVPTVFISGDEEICKRAKILNKNIVTVATKKCIGNSTINNNPRFIIDEIEAKVESALKQDLKQYVLSLPEDFEIIVSYKYHPDAYRYSHYPNAYQVSPSEIKYQVSDFYEVLRFLMFVI